LNTKELRLVFLHGWGWGVFGRLGVGVEAESNPNPGYKTGEIVPKVSTFGYFQIKAIV
jgi:hypothetical protein